MRKLIRKILPQMVRTGLRLIIRKCVDVFHGMSFRFARKISGFEFMNAPTLILKQKVMPSASYAQKMQNLRRAAELLSDIIIRPGEIFSFWHCMGRPAVRRGFAFSRTLIAGELMQTEGGGLCQVSGMLYEAALRLGFTILERFSHSVDIYSESERFTPLGLDAAVVYAFKDLRFRNDSREAIGMRWQIVESTITLQVYSLQTHAPGLSLWDIQIQRLPDNSGTAQRFVRVTAKNPLRCEERFVESVYGIRK